MKVKLNTRESWSVRHTRYDVLSKSEEKQRLKTRKTQREEMKYYNEDMYPKKSSYCIYKILDI